MRRFNTAGPVRADEHYRVPPLDRVSLAGVPDLIRSKAYFALYAPRQTGKTSALPALRDLLNDPGLAQTAAYMDLSAADAGHLVIFDMREGRTWAEKIYREERQQNSTPITVWGA